MMIAKFKSIGFSIFLIVLSLSITNKVYSQYERIIPKDSLRLAECAEYFTFMITSDLGRNGYYDQQPVAEMMGEVVDIAEPEFIAALGDIHHFQGIQSIDDPLWDTNFEWIYKHPELMIPWHPVMGNHEYRGNTEAFLQYTQVSRRWEIPSRYYSITQPISENVEAILLFIDTAPLLDKYINDPVIHIDAGKQSMQQELDWIDSVLQNSNAKWKIIMGHHPIYAGTSKTPDERENLQKRLQPILDKHGVDIAISGHIHNFQHIRVPESNIDYFVNTSASLTREVIFLEGTIFGSPDSGFSLCTIKESGLIISFINKEGEIIYQYERIK